MPSGFYNGSVMFADNVRFDGAEQPGQVTADGQLLIGSTVAPNIRVANLVSGDGSVTITNGAGTIDLSAGGSSGLTTLIGPQVDLLSLGDTIIYAFPDDFYPLFINLTGTDVTGAVAQDANYSVGWTAPNYQDIYNQINFYPAENFTFEVPIAISIGDVPLIPSGSTLYIKVTQADSTATTCVQRVDVIGYYAVSGGGGSGGVAAVSGTTGRITSTGGSSPIIDIDTAYQPEFVPNNYFRIVEDFLYNSVSGLWNVSGFTQASGIASSDHPGVFGTTAQSNGFRYIFFGQGSSLSGQMYLGGGEIEYNWVFSIATLSTGTNGYILALGLGDFGTTALATNGVYFSYSDTINGGNWTLNCIDATVATSTDSGVAATTGWHKASCVINALGTSAEFFIDGVSIGTVATNLPTANPVRPEIIVQWLAGTNAASNIMVDMFYMNQTLTNPR